MLRRSGLPVFIVVLFFSIAFTGLGGSDDHEYMSVEAL